MPPVRKRTRKIRVGSVEIGGDAPVSVQTMCTTRTTDPRATVEQTLALATSGADIVRITVPDDESAEGLAFILWVLALERATPTRVANTMTVNPIAAGLLATQLVGEPITLNLIVGLWALVSPWVLGFQGTTAMTVHVLIGAAVAVLAAIEIWLMTQNPPRLTTGR